MAERFASGAMIKNVLVKVSLAPLQFVMSDVIAQPNTTFAIMIYNNYETCALVLYVFRNGHIMIYQSLD